MICKKLYDFFYFLIGNFFIYDYDINKEDFYAEIFSDAWFNLQNIFLIIFKLLSEVLIFNLEHKFGNFGYSKSWLKLIVSIKLYLLKSI